MVDSHSLQSPNSSKDKESLLTSEFNLEDLSFTVADSFLNFDYIENWIEENPEPRNSMATHLKQSPVVSSSEEAEPVMFDGVPDLGSSVDKDRNEEGLVGEEGEVWGLSGSLGQETVGAVEIEKFGEMGCQSSGERIEGEERCLPEIQTRKVSLDGEVNNLVSAFHGMNGLKEDGNGGGVIGGSDAVKSVELSSASGEGTETYVLVGNSGEDGGINEKMTIDDNGQNGREHARDGDRVDGESESESEAQSSSSSSSESSSDSESDSESESESSSDEDDDDVRNQKVKGKKTDDMETEEGEIVASETEEMVAWSDEEDDGTGVTSTGPLRSKNELTDLPPVPPVNVTLQPHHQILPIGTVSSVLGAQVIVEGVEKHNPLNEGSILWITKSGSPLGLVDEIFGPVKNPYYIVRYNSESEIPAGVEPGTSISFVPEFANHVLHDKSLYQKGYDASGANDEEITDNEEFSDDEKEAEYKKMLKKNKRGKNDEKAGNQGKDEKKFGNRSKNWKQNPRNNTQEPMQGTKQPVDSSRHHMQPPNFSPNQGHQSLPARPLGQGFAPPPFAPPASAGFGTFPGGVNGIPVQQPQIVGLPQMPTNGMQMLPSMFAQQLFQMPPGSRFPFPQQMNATPQMPSNLVLPGCQPGFGAGAGFLPWPACLGQNAFMPASPFGMVGTPLQQDSLPLNAGQQALAQPAVPPIQQASAPTNAGHEASPSSISSVVYKHDSQQQPAFSSKPDTRQSFNQGRHNGGGRKSWRRGGGRFRGGRGGQNSG
ncbi:OLC1v1024089C1 [Oldenlandia corymbosa var. corymbosa]|uniref:H/ACA ribonucleoprotein complex non-core subunit NAF1 n=1 Tax=Oldenlandia corymbosa var. corymbosa TaxID=529605 RepID=A0AAV1C3W8_OLDCO|nr:OLC1v1024089C1 [Oldenlandia corymbosa var. corymbosa]